MTQPHVLALEMLRRELTSTIANLDEKPITGTSLSVAVDNAFTRTLERLMKA